VFVKPNLTWKVHEPGITTSPRFLELLVETLVERGCRVTIGESDGGNNLFTAEEAFHGHRLYELQARYSFKLLNLTRQERRKVRVDTDCEVEFPAPLLDDFDMIISVPVPKVHAITGVSLALKNLWGCLPNPMRLRHHWNINRVICTLVATLPSSAALVDGSYFLNDFGPMDGTPIRRDILAASNNLLAASLLCCRLMNVDPAGIPLLRAATDAGLGPRDLNEIHLNTVIDPFVSDFAFRAKAIPLTYVTRLAFHSRFMTAVLYDSWAGRLLHQALYRVRRIQGVRTVLYGGTRYVE
jgi:uncharacterized protein (DUF362 family)